MKSITPVVSVILLVMITIVAAGSAFFFINANIANLQAQNNLDSFPGMDGSRVNVVSVSGSRILLRNEGTSPVNELTVFLNGELLNYELDGPIIPGEIKEISYTPRLAGEDLEIKVIYNRGKTAQGFSPASINVFASGFTNESLPLNSLADCLLNGKTWLAGTITGAGGPCCQEASNFFYNGSLSITNHFCNAGVYFNQELDNNSLLCNYYGYDWLETQYYLFALSQDNDLDDSSVPLLGIVSNDFDKDSNLDLIISSYYFNDNYNFIYLKGYGNGSFHAPELKQAFYTNDIISSDFNKDGNHDIIIAAPNNLTYFEGYGNGSFKDAVTISSAGNFFGLVSSDFNEDGNEDLAAVVFDLKIVSYFEGYGNGSFKEAINYSASENNPRKIIAEDFNEDGSLDLIVNNAGSFSYFEGNGDGTFDANQEYISYGGAESKIVAGDFNNDGNVDVIISNAQSLSYFEGYGNGSFKQEINTSVGNSINDFKAFDFNKDGKLDLALATYYFSRLSYLEGKGDGTFKSESSRESISSLHPNIVLGDFNNDGNEDAVISNGYQTSYSYYKNEFSTKFYGKCCGDDGIVDIFYNSTYADSNNYCHQGIYYNVKMDAVKSICEYYGFDWLTGKTSNVFEDHFEYYAENEDIVSVSSPWDWILGTPAGSVTFKAYIDSDVKVGRFLDAESGEDNLVRKRFYDKDQQVLQGALSSYVFFDIKVVQSGSSGTFMGLGDTGNNVAVIGLMGGNYMALNNTVPVSLEAAGNWDHVEIHSINDTPTEGRWRVKINNNWYPSESGYYLGYSNAAWQNEIVTEFLFGTYGESSETVEILIKNLNSSYASWSIPEDFIGCCGNNNYDDIFRNATHYCCNGVMQIGSC